MNTTTESPAVRLTGLTKSFGANQVVQPLDLEIGRNEFFSILGPSGCGKTTLMRMITGFETPTGGSVELAGQNVDRVPTKSRDLNMLFQSYALFPHLSVYENVAFELRVRRTPKREIDSRVRDALDLVRLGAFAERKPAELSGGQSSQSSPSHPSRHANPSNPSNPSNRSSPWSQSRHANRWSPWNRSSPSRPSRRGSPWSPSSQSSPSHRWRRGSPSNPSNRSSPSHPSRHANPWNPSSQWSPSRQSRHANRSSPSRQSHRANRWSPWNRSSPSHRSRHANPWSPSSQSSP
ncbi:ABC transporter ATP-binding protein [Herbiconiux sp. P18]|uniref:ABC transporter ATP-binding protein n=1 Tax=Herbiconiux liangxiaofengii TaxID=3342795 RepID=UPI003CE86B19